MSKYDIVILGTGSGGLGTVLTLLEKNPKLKILMIDKGKDITNRGKSGLDLTCGFGGSGCWSDGKVTYAASNSVQYGGRLFEYVKNMEKFHSLMRRVDDTLMSFSDDKEVPLTGGDTEEIRKIKISAAKNNMLLLMAKVRHFGSDGNEKVMLKIKEYLRDKVEIVFETEMIDFIKKDNFTCLLKNKDKQYEVNSNYLVLMPGRSGNRWLELLAKEKGLRTANNSLDVGLRIEVPSWTTEHIDSILYEPKLIIKSPKNDLSTRTFCWNVGGFCVHEKIKDENGGEISTVNGYSNDKGIKSENTNFALLVSTTFTEPFNQPSIYGRSVAKLCNELAGGNILIQRLKDLKDGRRSTDKRIKEANIEPTLKTAVAGDISFGLPGRQLGAILEALEHLDRLMPGVNGNDTLLMAPEIKWFSAGIELKDNLETQIDKLYAGGDGASVSRGIAQSFASGIIIAEDILSRII